MNLLIDAGNTRIKWALVKGRSWISSGAIPTLQADQLPHQLPDTAAVRQIWVSNVAGDEVAMHIRQLQTGTAEQPCFIDARETQCGVRNGYPEPALLGSDRWAALIAAWRLVNGRCLVVNCGTAMTVDALSDSGEFIGGLILPGIDLMRRSLAAGTAQLRSEKGNYAEFPRNTADAIFSGAVQAGCGAIDRQRALLGKDAPVILCGGAAEKIEMYINQPLRLVDNLVLMGVELISQEEGM